MLAPPGISRTLTGKISICLSVGPANISITPVSLSDVISKNNSPIGVIILFLPLTTFRSLQNILAHFGGLFTSERYVNTVSFGALTTSVVVLEFIRVSLISQF